MIIETNLRKYIVFSEDSIVEALKKISDNKSRIIFSVTESGVLEGVVTDGDFRRWLVSQETINLNQPVAELSNKNFKFASFKDDRDRIQSLFSHEVEFIPLLDEYDRLVAIAHSRPTEGISIGEFSLNSKSSTFVIAEIGNNHNGSLSRAKELIDAAVEAGANCAKFQMRHLSSLYRNAGNSNDDSEDLGSQYTLDLLSRFQLEPEELLSAFAYCREKGIIPLCTPWDLDSLNLLEQYGMKAYKVASADLTNHDLLKALVATGKPLICSTGMATEAEIKESVALLKRLGAIYILLHCNSTYPAPFKDINLNYLARLKEIGDCLVGYSGHERDIYVAIASVAKGAKVIEKHLTLDRTMEGNDHKVSLLPHELKAMVEGIRQVELALGSSTPRNLSQGESINRETLAKSLVIDCNLQAGEIIKEEMIRVKSPGKGLQPNYKEQLIGRSAVRDFKAGDFFFKSDLESTQIKPRNYTFKRPWGIPVRYHDFKNILSKSNPDLLEFHLSYKDLEVDLNNYFDRVYDLDLVVHSPELFKGDLILDLCSPDRDYRQRSIDELQRVIEVTRKLKQYFSQATQPLIVTNVGGFTTDAPLPKDDREKRFELLLSSLSMLDTEGVEIIPQTMPPFPWHFGGQSYHNLFVKTENILEFCQHGYRVCLDVSHSKLACNHERTSFQEFIQKVGVYTAHLHLADGEKVDGEGLQIGCGEIDFLALAQILDNVVPQASFIPEIWQGHNNGGEGFWYALDRLEEWF